MIDNMRSEWSSLDHVASNMLDVDGYARFIAYKKQLKLDGHEWGDDAYDILSGFIWDDSEYLFGD